MPANERFVGRAKVGRIERGESAGVALSELIIIGAAVGVEILVRAHPKGPALRDNAHAALLERFRSLLHDSHSWATEVRLPNAGDMRAWGAMVRGSMFPIGVEAETRVRDGQALERRVRAKQRDGGVDVVVLILADTRANHEFVRERSSSMEELIPVPARES